MSSKASGAGKRKNSRLDGRKHRRIAIAAAAGASSLLGAILADNASAQVYTYSPVSTTADLWSAGTDWSSVPVSGATTELTFSSNSTTFASGLANTNIDDNAGLFTFNILDLNGTGPATGAATINIAASTANGSTLSFGGASNLVNLNANNGLSGGTLTYNVSAPISLGATTTFQGSGTATFKFSGSISGATFGIIQDATSTLILSGSDTFTGATAVSAGIVNYQNATAFGANSAITVSSGATVQVQGGIAGGTQTLTLSGTGATNATGALENVSGNNSYAGPITLGASSTISTDAGTLTLSGIVGDGGGGFGITKAGTGTLVFSGSNTFSGATAINAGILNYQNGAAFGGSSAITVASGATAQVQGNISGGTLTQTLTLSGTGAAGSTGALENVSGNNTYAGSVMLAAPTTISTDAGTLTLSNVVSGGSSTLTKVGAGTLTLTASATYTGNTTVNAGILDLSTLNGSLGSSSVTVNPQTQFSVDYGTASGTAAASVTRTTSLTLTGGRLNVTGTSNGSTNDNFGALTLNPGAGTNAVVSGGANAASISGGNNVIYVAPGSAKNTVLTFSGVTQNPGGTVTFTTGSSSSNIGASAPGSAGVNILFTTAPTLIGQPVTSGGTLNTTSTAVGIIPYATAEDVTYSTVFPNAFVTYDLVDGVRTIPAADYASNTLALSSGNLPQNVILTSEQNIPSGNTSTVNSLIINAPTTTFSETFAGTLVDNSGALLFSNGIGSGVAATISGGTLQLGQSVNGAQDAFITVRQGTGINIDSVISGPGSGNNLTISFSNANGATSVVALGASNTYAGGTIINSTNSGSAVLVGGYATGPTTYASGTTGTFGAGNVTLNNAQVDLNHSSSSPFTLTNNFSGTGTSVVEQIAAGAATLSGNISGSIGVVQNYASGSLTVSGNVTATGGITQSGTSGNLTVSGNISGTDSVTGSGTGGTLVLSGSNSYSGATTISAGALQLQANAGNITGSVTSALSNSSVLTLASGSALQLRSDSAVTFNPFGIATVGTANANNTISIDVGEVTSAGAGKTLTLGGGNLTFATNTTGTPSDTINVTSASGGDTLALGTVSAPSSGGGQYPVIINPTTASVTIGTFDTGAYGTILTFTGTSTATATLNNFVLVSNGSDGITVNGPTVILAQSNVTGVAGRQGGGLAVNLSAGTLDINNAGALSNTGSGTATTFTIAGGKLDSTFAGGITVAANPTISLAGDFTFGGTQQLNLGTGTVTLNGAAGARTITTNGTTNALTIGGPITSGTATALTKTGLGTLTLSSPGSTYAGGTTLSAGTLYIGANSTVSAGTVTAGPIGTGTLTVVANATLGAFTPGGNLSNPITLNSGVTLSLNSTGAAALSLNGAITGPSNSTIDEIDANRDILDGSLASFNGTIEETGAVAAGIYVAAPAFNGQNVAFVANGSNSYAFLPTPTAATSTFYMGSLAGNNAALLLRPASASSAGTLTLQIGTLNANTTYAGYIQDYGSTKIALSLVGGSLTLNDSNISYSGGTTISSGGTLVANSTDMTNGSTGPGAVNVVSAGTLAGTGQVRGSVTVNGTITAGSSATTGAPGLLTINNSASTTTLAGNGAYSVKINSANASGTTGAGTSWDEIVLSKLAVTAVSGSGSPFTVTPVSLAAGNVAGPIGSFSASTSDVWQIATATSVTGINLASGGVGSTTVLATDGGVNAPTPTTGDSGIFALNTSAFAMANGTTSSTGNYELELVEQSSTNFDLDLAYNAYNASPEPGSAMLILGGVAPMLLARRRSRAKGRAVRD